MLQRFTMHSTPFPASCLEIRPRLLDLFCGVGGAAMGYHRAGFDVTGVDITPQKRYPFPFIQGDALEYVREHWQEYDAIHASPPCQAYSVTQNLPWTRRDHPRLLEPTQAVMDGIPIPWVIENVPLSPLRNPVMLCGTMFGLQLFRHRLFESNCLLLTPAHSKHVFWRHPGQSAMREGSMDEDMKQAGLGWMTQKERREAIPPAYTEYLGKQLILYRQTASYGT